MEENENQREMTRVINESNALLDFDKQDREGLLNIDLENSKDSLEQIQEEPKKKVKKNKLNETSATGSDCKIYRT